LYIWTCFCLTSAASLLPPISMISSLPQSWAK
jgi:hypothetical protein